MTATFTFNKEDGETFFKFLNIVGKEATIPSNDKNILDSTMAVYLNRGNVEVVIDFHISQAKVIKQHVLDSMQEAGIK